MAPAGPEANPSRPSGFRRARAQGDLMSDTKPTIQGTAAESSDRRRSHRVYISMPVLVRGKHAGQTFEEATQTISVSAHGGLLRRRGQADPGPDGLDRQRQDGRGASLHRHVARPKGKWQDRSRRRIHRTLAALLAHRISARGLGPIRAQAPRFARAPSQPAAATQARAAKRTGEVPGASVDSAPLCELCV